ncbi:unnamed protein product [Caenorhabditis angaria]|uniref:ubiquitinyl hydrolase 1 n=1 Tax=Caenorhabditis angaria TaxID=860376 RepID=A0A9P1I3T4_9PELO|nr:unnamed protein product [Caenorhabditis angaria]
MSKPKQKEKPNQRKMAFRQEATDALLQLENDSQVTFEKAMEVAKLDCRQCKLHDISHNAKHQNCRDNPFCINRLGLEKFEKLINLEVQNREDARINQKRRDLNDQPSGLVNNGNFCYVNSFLQVWFSVIEFRQIIYDFRPSRDYIAPELPRMNVERVMMALQDLFFTMQTTPFMDTDKNDTLIRELRLNQEQQDAQEFALMLFDALDRNLQLHPNGNPIRERIKNLYMGSTCSRIFCECGMSSERLEVSTSLQLNIDGHATLLDALSANFGVEKLDDYKCSECGQKGRVSRMSDYAELPPVVIIQLNRYKYTSKGRQKLKTTLAYPREISARIFKQSSTDVYELFAVTIHEGNNAECGHYYDLIKSPLNQKWYRYNDATVEALQKPPGTEKPTTEINAKAKRAKNEKVLTDQKSLLWITPKLPPEEIIQESKRKIEEMFEGQTKSKIEKSEKRLYDLQRRVEKLKNNFSKLETHEGKFQHPNEIAFLPTSLISNILEGEFEIAKGNKNTGKKSTNPPENLEKSQEENEETQAENTEIPIENPENIPPPVENLDILAIAMTSSELLPNLPENEERRKTRAQNGITKSVYGHSGSSKSPRKEKLIKLPISSQVSNLLDSHEMPICGHGKMSIESILFGDVKAVSRAPAISLLREYDYRAKMVFDDGRREYPQPEKEKEVFVFTAEDICMDCVLEMRIEGIFNDRLEDDDRLARKILKEEKLRCSVKCPLPKPDDYFYVAKVALMNFKKMANNERQFKLNRVLTKGGTLFFDSVQSQKQDPGFADVCTNLKRLRWKTSSFSSSNRKSEGIPPEKMAKLDSSFLEPEDLGSLEMESTSSNSNLISNLNLVPNVVQMAVAEDQTRPSSRSTPASNMVSQPVEFNGELRCAHGGINYNQFRHAVSPEEWQRLIHYFDDNFEVHCNDQVCDLCQQQEEDAQNGSLNMRILVREMRKRLTDTLKNIDLREENPEISEVSLEFGICSVFLDKLRKLTQRNATSPPHICQNCLLCPEHSRPFKGFQSLMPEKKDAYIVGLTAEEWHTITQEIQKLEEVEGKTNSDTPHVILITSSRNSEGSLEEDREERSVVDLCHVCYEQNIRRIEEMKYQFENELVYVKLVQPNDDCAETTKNRGAAKSTRRRKDIIGVKLSSSSRLLDLKIALYDKCYQSPTDQLLYRAVGGELLDATCHEKTLYELKLLPNNNDNPLILMANTNAAIHSTLPEDTNSDRAPERGFVDTALAH